MYRFLICLMVLLYSLPNERAFSNTRPMVKQQRQILLDKWAGKGIRKPIRFTLPIQHIGPLSGPWNSKGTNLKVTPRVFILGVFESGSSQIKIDWVQAGSRHAKQSRSLFIKTPSLYEYMALNNAKSAEMVYALFSSLVFSGPQEMNAAGFRKGEMALMMVSVNAQTGKVHGSARDGYSAKSLAQQYNLLHWTGKITPQEGNPYQIVAVERKLSTR